MNGPFLKTGPTTIIDLGGDWVSDSKAWGPNGNQIPNPNNDPGNLLSKEVVLRIVDQLFPPPGAPLNSLASFDQCGEILWTRVLVALRYHPEWIPEVESILDDRLANITQIHTSNEFTIKTDPSLSFGTADGSVFDNAYMRLFSFLPLPPLYENWIHQRDREVVLCDLGRVRGMTSPGHPIYLNQKYFGAGGNRSFQAALAAHELFHKVQYRHGFRFPAGIPPVPTTPPEPFAWFSEGGAAWAEFFVTAPADPNHRGWVTSKQKMMAAYTHPELPLRNASYYAAPYWLRSWTATPPVDVIKSALDHGAPGIQQTTGPAFAAFANRVAGAPVQFHTLSDDGSRPVTRIADVQWKKVNIGTGVTIVGWLGECAGLYFEVEDIASPMPVFVGVSGPAMVHVTPDQPMTSSRRFGIFAESEGPFNLTILPQGGHPTPPSIFPTDVASTGMSVGDAGQWQVSLDSAGNIIVTGPSSAVIGYSVSGFSSIGKDSLTQPAFLNSWFERTAADMAVGGSSRQASIQQKFPLALGFARTVKRTVTKTDDSLGIMVTTETADGNPIGGFESVLLTGNPGSDDGRYDPDSSATCARGSFDCDGDCRPLWPVMVMVDGRAMDPNANLSTIVPYSGKAIIVIPGGRLIQETFTFARPS